jgi:sugar lactone lactonase YvrE
MKLEVVADGFGYLESPRWHDNALWFSDFDARVVLALRGVAEAMIVAEIAGVPSGLAFTPDGLLVSSMRDQLVLRIDPTGTVSTWADLSGLAVHDLNDMTHDARGNVYVGCFGYDLVAREKPRAGPLLHLDSARVARVACADLMFANGMAVMDAGETDS